MLAPHIGSEAATTHCGFRDALLPIDAKHVKKDARERKGRRFSSNAHETIRNLHTCFVSSLPIDYVRPYSMCRYAHTAMVGLTRALLSFSLSSDSDSPPRESSSTRSVCSAAVFVLRPRPSPSGTIYTQSTFFLTSFPLHFFLLFTHPRSNEDIPKSVNPLRFTVTTKFYSLCLDF